MMNGVRLDLQKVALQGLQALGAVESVIANAGLDKILMHLVKLRVSQINGCVYCVGLHHKEALDDGESQTRLDHLVVWRDTDLYSPAERAAITWAEALTVPGNKANLDLLYEDLAEQLSPAEIGTLMLVVVMINTWNRVQIAAHGSSF